MKLSELLHELHEEPLNRIAHTIRADVQEGMDKHALVDQIGSFYRDEASCRKVYEEIFSEHERFLLLFLVREVFWEGISFRQMEERLQDQVTGMELKAAVVGLREKGVLFAFRKLWGEIIYTLPRDTAVMWQRVLWRGEASFLAEEKVVKNMEIVEEASPGLHMDLYTMLRFIATHSFPLTQKGRVHKRHVVKCTDLLKLSSRHLQRMTLRYLDQDAYPRPFAVVLDVALRMGLVNKQPEGIDYDEHNVQAWLQQTPEQAAWQVMEQWMRVNVPPKVWLQHALVIMMNAPGEWVQAQGLVEYIRSNGASIAQEDPIRWLEEELFMPLCGLGWLDIGTIDEERVIRWTGPDRNAVTSLDPDASNRVYVQPNFEIAIPPTAQLSIRWLIEDFTELQASEPMTLCTITKDSLHRALEAGAKLETMIGFLEKHSMYPIPANVKETLVQWGEQFGRVRFVEAVVMRCADVALAKEIENNPKFKKWLVEKISETDFMIRRSDAEDCIRLLEQYDYAPKKEIQSIEAQISKGRGARGRSNHSQTSGRKGIIQSRWVYDHYAIDHAIPRLEDVVPILQKLTPAWTNDYRSYHLSTLRDIVQHAVELQTKVRWRIGSEDVSFVPVEVRHTGNRWVAFGQDDRGSKHSEVDLSEVSRIQIVLPGGD